MYSARSYRLTQGEFNYLLPAVRNKLSESNGKYYLIARDTEDLDDLLGRLMGHYDNHDDLKNMVAYHCFKEYSLRPFRESIGVTLDADAFK